jgi:hypothetical protein
MQSWGMAERISLNDSLIVGAGKHPDLIGERQHMLSPLPADLLLRPSTWFARIG